MAITLTPELEAIVVEDAQALGYENAEAYLASQLTAVHEAELYLRENRDALEAMMEEGWESAERDGWLNPEDAKREIAEWKKGFLAKRSAA
ncbi:MAG TPA: hypothetical protein VFC39_19265 [Acidobacteriaceae bacterium]|nr:hypothetical protein [Acidobacteriaceae bacterium]